MGHQEFADRVAHFLGVGAGQVALTDVNTYRKRTRIVRTL
jgi:hypothetical protein